MTSHITDQQLAVITKDGSAYGIQFLKMLNGVKRKPKILIVEPISLIKRFKMARFLSRKIGIIDAIRYNKVFFFKHIKNVLMMNRFDYSMYADYVLYSSDVNCKSVRDALDNHEISKVILAQSSIIKKTVLDRPGQWIVNCHPGKLPKMRGVDVVKWSLFELEQLCVTLHTVAAGVDTGDILKEKDIPVYEDDSIEDIENRSITISLDLLLCAAIHGPALFPVLQKQKIQNGIQHYLMPFVIQNQLRHNFNKIKNYYIESQNI